jgi:hypothetical protein
VSLDIKVLDRLDGLAKMAVDDSKVDIKALDLINGQDVNGWVRSKYLRLYFDRKAYYREYDREVLK